VQYETDSLGGSFIFLGRTWSDAGLTQAHQTFTAPASALPASVPVTSAGAPVSDRLCASLGYAMVGFVTGVLDAGVSNADGKSALRNRLRPDSDQQLRDAPPVSRRGFFFTASWFIWVYLGLFY
jgi:hypothetical protein